jgi:hypothetical protein
MAQAAPPKSKRNSVVLRNSSEKIWEDRIGGQYYICDPGSTITLPEEYAKHFIGDWDLEDTSLRAQEEERVKDRAPGGEGEILLELVKVVPPPHDEEPFIKEKKWEPATIIKQEAEPEFPDLEKLRKRKKK